VRYFRDTLLESSEYDNVFDMPADWWAAWKEKHKDEYDLEADDFKKTVTVKKGGDVVFLYDRDRNKVFTDRPLKDLTTEAEKIPGGLSSGKSVKDIASKHGVPVGDIEAQLEKGRKVEMEHTDDPAVATEIAKDHLTEDPAYYDKLEKAKVP
jgi:hypothetical protein